MRASRLKWPNRTTLRSWVAARRALDRFGLSKAMPGSVAAVSLGIVGGELLSIADWAPQENVAGVHFTAAAKS